jgi:hypothetical protein
MEAFEPVVVSPVVLFVDLGRVVARLASGATWKVVLTDSAIPFARTASRPDFATARMGVVKSGLPRREAALPARLPLAHRCCRRLLAGRMTASIA